MLFLANNRDLLQSIPKLNLNIISIGVLISAPLLLMRSVKNTNSSGEIVSLVGIIVERVWVEVIRQILLN